MELRKDPITRSWVITRDAGEPVLREQEPCRFCPTATQPTQVIASVPSVDGSPWGARAVVHPSPLYHVEGDAQRTANGLYDTMAMVGAHEVLVENPVHDRHIWKASNAEIGQFLRLIGSRLQDLKKDQRLKYMTVYKDHGWVAGQEFDHPTSQLTATTFIPRRVLYELRACRDYYEQKERCVFCDIVSQEERQKVRIIEARGDYLACCPFAPRVPYETWLLPRVHESAFEGSVMRRDHTEDLASLLRRTLIRIRSISEDFHLVLHTLPNTAKHSDVMGYWETINDDYHWHIEILPIVPSRAKPYSFKETYYTDVTPETAAARLRDASPE